MSISDETNFGEYQPKHCACRIACDAHDAAHAALKALVAYHHYEANPYTSHHGWNEVQMLVREALAKAGIKCD